MPPAPTDTAAPDLSGASLNLQPQGQAFNPSPAPPQAPPAQGSTLDEASRTKLDGIVQQMQTNGETDQYIQNVVDDFKQKYGTANTPAPDTTPVMTSAGTNISPANVAQARGAVQGSLYSMMQQAEQGAGQVFSGINQAAQPGQAAGNMPLGLARAGMGVVNAITSPLAPIMKPIGDFINNNIIQPAANAISNIPGVQKIAQSPLGTTIEKGAEGVQNLSGIAGAIAGFGKPSEIGTEVGTAAKTATQGVANVANRAVESVTPSLEENVGKALGFTGKMNAGSALGKTAQSTRALQTIVDNAPNIKVTDANGIEVPFNPSKATFAETLDAWKQTRDAIYKQYSDLAAKAGGTGAVFTPENFTNLETTLNNVTKNATGAFKTKAASLVKDLQENFGSIDPKTGSVIYKNTPLSDMQDFVEKVNTDVNPLSDKAGAQVSLALSQQIRGLLDSKIQDATGKGYQVLRNKYADLKSVESDLVNQFKKAARGQGGTIAKYVEGFGSLDVILAIFKGSPIEALGGAGMFGIGKMMEYLKDPTRALQRAFKQIQSSKEVGKSNQPQTTNASATNITSPANIAIKSSTSAGKINPQSGMFNPGKMFQDITGKGSAKEVPSKVAPQSTKAPVSAPSKSSISPEAQAAFKMHPEDIQFLKNAANIVKQGDKISAAKWETVKGIFDNYKLLTPPTQKGFADFFQQIYDKIPEKYGENLSKSLRNPRGPYNKK